LGTRERRARTSGRSRARRAGSSVGLLQGRPKQQLSCPARAAPSSARFRTRDTTPVGRRREIFFRLRAPAEGPRHACYPSAMFDIGLQEMLVIGVLALLVFGPSKLPELGRMVVRALREFRRSSDEFRSTVETNLHINEPDPPPASSYAAAPSEPAVTPPLPSESE